MVEPKPKYDRDGRRDTANREPCDDAPIDSAAEAERGGCYEFRAGGKQQIGTHGHCGRLSKDEHQYGGHQGSATDAGETHQSADNQAAEGVEEGSRHVSASVPGRRRRS